MIKIMFVCHGNICRSTMAEFVMKDLVHKAGMDEQIFAASSACRRDEIGSDTHPGTKAKLRQLGIPFTKRRAVQFTQADYAEYDYIAAMDRENLRDLKRLDKRGQWEGKIVPMCFFTTRFLDEEVPDPYYGGQEGFDHVVELLQDGCANLLENLKDQLS